MNLAGGERILVVKPSSLGDIVHALPAVAAVKKSFPDTEIHWLANTEWTPVLEGSPAVDQVIAFPRKEFRGLSGLFRGADWAKKSLSPNGYDVALDFQGLLRSVMLARLGGAKRIVGFSEAREGAHLLYSNRIAVPDWRKQHAVDRNLRIAEAIGADIADPVFPLPEGDPVEIPDSHAGNAILLHPFSRGRGKSLSFAEVDSFCKEVDPTPVWIVGRAETPTPAWPGNALDLLDRTSLPQLIHLLRRAAYSVSVDSGPMHLAAALSDRVLSIHTWSDPGMVGPWRSEAQVWRDSQILKVSGFLPGTFPERRDLRDEFAKSERLLPEGEIEHIAKFVLEQTGR